MRKPRGAVVGTVLDAHLTLSLSELCRMCGASIELITEMVEEGIVDPAGCDPQHWNFTGEAVQRVQVVRRLTEDLRVNLPGAALALELMDELDALRQQAARRESAEAVAPE